VNEVGGGEILGTGQDGIGKCNAEISLLDNYKT
jgi:hypothetical protein